MALTSIAKEAISRKSIIKSNSKISLSKKKLVRRSLKEIWTKKLCKWHDKRIQSHPYERYTKATINLKCLENSDIDGSIQAALKYLREHGKRKQICRCLSCRRRRLMSKTYAYVCYTSQCFMKFHDYLDLFEHQVETHGCIQIQCRHVHRHLMDKDHGNRQFPPQTIYVGYHFLSNGQPPVVWTLEDLELQRNTLKTALCSEKVYRWLNLAWKLFQDPYLRVIQAAQSGNWTLVAELLAYNYSVALEFYLSSLQPKLPYMPHGNKDGVGNGRNWFLQDIQ